MNAPTSAWTRRRSLLGVGFTAAAAGAGLAWWRYLPGKVLPQEVQAFWSSRFDQLTGEELQMARLRGRPLLVNFWATWCPPCIDELPMIEAFWRQNSSKGIQVLALAVDQPAAVRRFLMRQPLDLPVALAGVEGASLSRTLGNAQGGLPFSVFFKADGSIYQQKIGKMEVPDLEGWRQALERGQA